MQTLTLTKPDDFHLHLRDDDYLATTVPASAKQFARAIVMPNLKLPVTTIETAKAYQQRILAAVPKENSFQPLMTLYLTDQTTAESVQQAKKSGIIFGYKFYPAGATTHSEAGVTSIEKITAALETMAEFNMPLLIHGEVVDNDVDVFEREQRFIEKVLQPLLQRIPQLKIVLEHISTQDAVEFVKSTPANVAATITVHHLLLNRNHLLVGGIRPHYYCLPIVKQRHHQEALIVAATSGNPKFFLGTDSAPHAKNRKENACGCAGIYTAHAAIELYAEAFEQAKALDKLENFASRFGADFYGLSYNNEKITLQKQTWQAPNSIPFGNEELVPFRAGEIIEWRFMATACQ